MANKINWTNKEINLLKNEIKVSKKYGLTVAFEEAAMKLPRTLGAIEKFYFRNKQLFK